MTGGRALLALAAVLACAFAARAQKPSDPNHALVLEARGEVSSKGPDGKSVAVAKGAEILRGQLLITGVDSEAKLAFTDGSVMTVSEMSEIRVADLLAAGKRQAVAVQLKMGEVAAQVNPKKDFQTDFKVSTPTGTASVRGTEIKSISYHPARGTVIALLTGSLLVQNNAGASTSLAAGDSSKIQQDGHLVPPQEFVAAESRFQTNATLTSSEQLANTYDNQPVPTAPTGGTTQDIASQPTGSFIFVFHK